MAALTQPMYRDRDNGCAGTGVLGAPARGLQHRESAMAA